MDIPSCKVNIMTRRCDFQMKLTKYTINKEGTIWITRFDIDVRTNDKDFMEFIDMKLDQLLDEFKSIKNME